MRARTKIIFLFFLIICLFINDIVVESKKKKKAKNKKKKDDLMENGLPTPDSIRPSFISPELLCDSCQAIITEAVKRLGTKTSEVDVLYYMDKVCDPEKYYIYHFPPPDMKSGCQTFIGAYGDEIPKVLVKRNKDSKADDLIQKLCFKVTKVCEGIDLNNVRRMDDHIEIDGEPVKLNITESNSYETQSNGEKASVEELKQREEKEKVKKKEEDL